MLRRSSYGHEWKQPAPPADFRMPLHVHMPHQFLLVSDRHMFIQHTVGTDDDIFSHSGFRMNDGRGMNFHHTFSFNLSIPEYPRPSPVALQAGTFEPDHGRHF